MHIKYGYDEYFNDAVNINPLNPCLRAENNTGTDYKLLPEDIPLFWQPNIKFFVEKNIDQYQSALGRDQYYIDLISESFYSFQGSFTQANIPPMDWISNHLKIKHKGLEGGISFIILMEQDRLPVFENTYQKYVSMIPDFLPYEFLIISRTMTECNLPNTRIVNYTANYQFFNTTMGLNIGVRESKYQNLLVTCPEIIPTTDVITQLLQLPRNNYICQVFDQNEDGSVGTSLVNTNYRNHIPMYFLGIFKKEDVIAINGWDEEFMHGFAWEDVDFGERFVRAGLQFKVLDDVQALHIWHPRNYHNEGWNVNYETLMRNHNNNVTVCKKGIIDYSQVDLLSNIC